MDDQPAADDDQTSGQSTDDGDNMSDDDSTDYTDDSSDGDSDGDYDDGCGGADDQSSADTSDDAGQNDNSGDFNAADYTDANSLNGSSDGDTLSMSEKWHSLTAAPGYFVADAYDRVAAVYDMVTGDDAAADRHIDDADAEGDGFSRNLRQAFGGKRIEPSRAEDQRWQRMLDEK